MEFHCETKFQKFQIVCVKTVIRERRICFTSVIFTSHLLVSRHTGCVVHYSNLQSLLIKYLMNGTGQFPVLWCSTVYKTILDVCVCALLKL